MTWKHWFCSRGKNLANFLPQKNKEEYKSQDRFSVCIKRVKHCACYTIFHNSASSRGRCFIYKKSSILILRLCLVSRGLVIIKSIYFLRKIIWRFHKWKSTSVSMQTLLSISPRLIPNVMSPSLGKLDSFYNHILMKASLHIGGP